MNLLSNPSKMPCASFNIPALKFCPAAKLVQKIYEQAKDNISKLVCSSCYACKGFYMMPNVAEALQNKGKFITTSIRENDGDAFVAEMCKQIRTKYFDKKGNKKKLKNLNTDLFRVHDSGDLFSAKYIDCWIRIVKEFPSIRFWFPTREYIRKDQRPHLRRLAELPNAIVKPSALEVNEPAPKGRVVRGLDMGTAVYDNPEQAIKDGHDICPATKHIYEMGKAKWKALPKNDRAYLASCAGNNCTECWVKNKAKPTAYLAH